RPFARPRGLRLPWRAMPCLRGRRPLSRQRGADRFSRRKRGPALSGHSLEAVSAARRHGGIPGPRSGNDGGSREAHESVYWGILILLRPNDDQLGDEDNDDQADDVARTQNNADKSVSGALGLGMFANMK